MFIFRRIFPTLQFSLEGLDCNRFYTVCVDMIQVGNSQWKYQSSRWMPTGKAQRPLPSKFWCLNTFNPLTPTVAVYVHPVKHPVPDRVQSSFVIFDIRALQRSRMSVRVPGCQK